MYSFKETLQKMALQGMHTPSERVTVQIPDAKKAMQDAMSHFLAAEHKKMVWLPEYDTVANWLTNNGGKGLFLYGNCGRGKSLLCRYVLPAILLQYCNKVVSVFDTYEMNKNIDQVITKHLISLDDIGTEEVSYSYGNKRLAFAEIIDAAEKKGKLLIVSTNLQAVEIQARYGDRTLDRIRAVTQRVLFRGDSLRW